MVGDAYERYLGPLKHRGRFFLKLERKIVHSEYTIHSMVDRKGRKAMFYNIKNENRVEIQEGDCIALTGTIAKYRMYKEEPQTYLNRCVLIENKGSLNPKTEEVADKLTQAPAWS